MKVLIMMLFNTTAKTYHPIMYFESPLPGLGSGVTRYKSKGHRTEGFTERQDAILSIQTEVIDRLDDSQTVVGELEGDILWDGTGIPADIQFR